MELEIKGQGIRDDCKDGNLKWSKCFGFCTSLGLGFKKLFGLAKHKKIERGNLCPFPGRGIIFGQDDGNFIVMDSNG